MDWSPLWSLAHEELRWIPTAMTYYAYRGDLPVNGMVADSNGNAAGTSLEDAILQGCFELVERDAVALWWYNRVARPAVDLDAYAAYDGFLEQLRAWYADELDRDTWALDLTSDLGIPAAVALSRARQGRPRVLVGFGAHGDPRVALTRALTEMNQMLTMIDSLEGGAPPEEGDHTRPEVEWWHLEHLDDHPHLMPDSDLPPRPRTITRATGTPTRGRAWSVQSISWRHTDSRCA